MLSSVVPTNLQSIFDRKWKQHLYSLLKEKNSYEHAKQLPCNSCKPCDNCASIENCKQNQKDSRPNTNPATQWTIELDKHTCNVQWFRKWEKQKQNYNVKCRTNQPKAERACHPVQVFFGKNCRGKCTLWQLVQQLLKSTKVGHLILSEQLHI